jgi:hypothetical protein
VKLYSPRAHPFYVDALTDFSQSDIPFLVGGGFALEQYTYIERRVKDVDVFIRRVDVDRALHFFRSRGYTADLTFPHWLAKVYDDYDYVDVIFSSGNGVAEVDDDWFTYAVSTDVLGVPVRLCPPEETIWSKAFVQERERFDGADVLHLLRRFGEALNWVRLLARFGPHWRVLFGHIIMFGFVYPDRRDSIPRWVVNELAQRVLADDTNSADTVCNGPLLSRAQYLFDLTHFAYEDPRLAPRGRLSREELEMWTAGIDRDQ